MGGIHRIPADLRKADFPAASRIFDIPGTGRLFAWGTSVPSGTSGYAKGCIFIDHDAAAGSQFWINEGTSSSCSFTAVASGGAGAATSMADLAIWNDTAGLNVRVDVTNQTSSRPDLVIPDFAGTGDEFVFKTKSVTLANKTLTSPAINGGNVLALDSFSLNDDTTTAFDLIITSDSTTPLSGDRILTIDVNNAARMVDLGGNLVLGGTLTTSSTVSITGALVLAGAWTHSGAHTVGLTTTGNTTLIFPEGGANIELMAFDNSVDAQGDIMFRGASAYERLGTGTAGQALLSAGAASDLYWGSPSVGVASSLDNGCTLEDAGGNDAVLAFTTQTVSAPTLTVPNFASVSDTFAFITLAQTFINKTLTSPAINGGNVLALDSFSLNDDTTPGFDLIITSDSTTPLGQDRTLTFDVNNANRMIDISGDIVLGGTLTTLGAWTQVGSHSLEITTSGATTIEFPTAGTMAVVDGALGDPTITTINNYTMTAPASGATLVIADGKTFTCNASITLTGTDAKTLTLSESMTLTAAAGAQTFTFPATGANVCTISSADTLTQKGYDCNGSGNALTNVDCVELKPGADGVDGLAFIITKTVANLDATGTAIYTDNAPRDFRVLDVWFVATTGAGGDFQLNNGKVGTLGNPITTAVTVGGGDKELDRAVEFDDDEWDISTGGSLVAVGDSGGTIDGEMIILCQPR